MEIELKDLLRQLRQKDRHRKLFEQLAEDGSIGWNKSLPENSVLIFTDKHHVCLSENLWRKLVQRIDNEPRQNGKPIGPEEAN